MEARYEILINFLAQKWEKEKRDKEITYFQKKIRVLFQERDG